MVFLEKKKLAPISRVCKQILHFSLDIIYPRFCIGCGDEGSWLCAKCKNETIAIQMQTCPSCNKLSDNGLYCLKCRDDKHLNGVIVADYYEEGPTKELIHNFKYNHILELKKYLGGRLIKALTKSGIQCDFITFAPLHYRRLATRGYNQSEELASEVALKTKVPIKNLLIKIKNTKRQVGLKSEARKSNLSGVFKLTNKNLIRGKKIIIVDDILTTGTTLNECAKVLKEAGAKKVWGLVLAKG